jgi:hypothetical protein
VRPGLAVAPLMLAALVGGGLAASGVGACKDGIGASGVGGGGGQGGEGGASVCPTEVAPLFTLRVGGPGGALPDDLVLSVSWSAGDEPPVILADASTFGSSASNVICARVPAALEGEGGGDPSGPSGAGGQGGGSSAGEDLLCELWTSGPTRVVLEASGFLTVDQTLPPATLEDCDRPVPSTVEIVIEVEEDDDEDE